MLNLYCYKNHVISFDTPEWKIQKTANNFIKKT